MDGKVTLKVDPTVPPVRMPLRKLPVPIKDRVSAELKQLQENGIIAPVTEPTAWLSALLVMGGGTGGYRGYMYPPPFLEGGYKRVHSVKVCVYPVVR